jgi:hypothetical protein
MNADLHPSYHTGGDGDDDEPVVYLDLQRQRLVVRTPPNWVLPCGSNAQRPYPSRRQGKEAA